MTVKLNQCPYVALLKVKHILMVDSTMKHEHCIFKKISSTDY